MWLCSVAIAAIVCCGCDGRVQGVLLTISIHSFQHFHRARRTSSSFHHSRHAFFMPPPSTCEPIYATIFISHAQTHAAVDMTPRSGESRARTQPGCATIARARRTSSSFHHSRHVFFMPPPSTCEQVYATIFISHGCADSCRRLDIWPRSWGVARAPCSQAAQQ